MESPLDKIARLEKELAQIKQSLQTEVKLELGKWYYGGEGIYKFIIRYTGASDDANGDSSGDIIFEDGDSEWDSPRACDIKSIQRLAMSYEIKSALIKEAEKRGFKEGVKVSYKNFINELFRDRTNTTRTDPARYYESEDGLYVGSSLVYKKGIWAEIIKDTPITICGYGVIFHPKAQQISVNGKNYTFNEIKTLHSIMSAGQVKSLNVGCNEQEKVTLEIVERIIAKING